MLTRKKVLSLGAAVLAGAGLLAAQAPRFHHGDPSHRLQMLATALDLTDAQKQQAQVIFDAARQQSQPVAAQLKQGHESMAAAIKAGKPESDLDQIAAQQGALVGQLAGIHAKAFSKFYALLTPDQKTKADKLHQEFAGAFASRFGPRHAPAPQAAPQL
jgi:Spy/CpxP family protein refolding chaperone